LWAGRVAMLVTFRIIRFFSTQPFHDLSRPEFFFAEAGNKFFHFLQSKIQ
jgi:hypothetical protein